jgi:hypothetical protein
MFWSFGTTYLCDSGFSTLTHLKKQEQKQFQGWAWPQCCAVKNRAQNRHALIRTVCVFSGPHLCDVTSCIKFIPVQNQKYVLYFNSNNSNLGFLSTIISTVRCTVGLIIFHLYCYLGLHYQKACVCVLLFICVMWWILLFQFRMIFNILI